MRGACCAVAVSAALAGCGGGSMATSGSSDRSPAKARGPAILTVESSQQNSISRDLNPYVSSSAASLLGATSLIYEPLLQANAMLPGMYYRWLATSYRWSDGGDSITFAIRRGVRWSNGSRFTAADVAFTFRMLERHPDVNTTGLPISSVTSSGNDVTINFPSPQYANLQNIAAEVYIVPRSIWSKVRDPGAYVDRNPVGTGPYTLASFTSRGFILKANPAYWSGPPPVPEVQFPTYASGNAAGSALATDRLDWAGNFIAGLQQRFLAGNPSHHVWFAPVQTNSLEPNLTTFPTDQLAVRQAISLALDRTALSEQAEGGLEPPVSTASGLTLPVFQAFLSPAAADTLSAHSNIAAARALLSAAGYVIGPDGMFQTRSGRRLTIEITDPSSFSDYATGDAMIAGWLRQAGIDATFVGQSVTAWSSDIASGNFQLTQHWSQTSVSPYQLYNDWLGSTQATSNAAGDYERLADRRVEAMLGKLAGDDSLAAQQADLAPIERYVATNLPIIPTVYGVAFDEYNTSDFPGWPTSSNTYESGSPSAPTNEVVILHLSPAVGRLSTSSAGCPSDAGQGRRAVWRAAYQTGSCSAASGRPIRNPCRRSQPISRSVASCSRVSTPSATIETPRWCPSSVTIRTRELSRPSGSCSTNDRSILISSTVKCWRCASEV
jgi:peptide/nickel transport system substrate-binding protein